MPSWEEQLRKCSYGEEDLMLHTEEGDFKVEIKIDRDPENPRTAWDNASHFLFSHRRYDLADDGLWEKLGINTGMFDSWHETMKWLKKNEDICCAFIVRGYEHGGLTISVSGAWPYNDSWDSGTIGIAYMTKKDVRDNFMVKRITKETKEKAEALIKAEVETFDDYLTNNVYRYNVEHEEFVNMEDSCGGYFGDPKDSGILDEIVGYIKFAIQELKNNRIARHKKQFGKLKAQMRHRVPLRYRKPFQY